MANSLSHAALPYPIRKARFSIEAAFVTSAGVLTDPTTPDTELSTDGGASFTDAAEEITTGGGNGVGYLTLTGAEMDNPAIAVALKSANCVTRARVLIPRALALIGSGTLSAGSAGGGTLGTLLAYDVTGCFLRTTGGTGGGGTGGANNQARKIATYNTSTGAFTVSPNWETTPDNTTTYDVLLPEGVTLGMLQAINPATPGRKPVVDANGLIDATAVKVGPSGSATAQTAGDLSSQLTTIAGYVDTEVAAILAAVDTEVAAIKVKTDSLTFTVANQVDVNVTNWKGSTAPAMTGDAFARLGAPAGASIAADIAALNNLSQSDIRTALGMASANLDTQLAAIAGYIDTEVAAILAAVDTEVAAIKVKTDQMVFTNAGRVDASLQAAADVVTAVCNKLADHVRRRTQANVEASAFGDALDKSSLYGMIQQLQNSTMLAGTLTVKKTDGTTLGTLTFTSDAAADPVTGVS